MLILSAGVGFVTCKDKPQVMRVAKVFCATWGLVYGVGVSGYAQIAGASHSGPCRAKDLREFRTSGYVAFIGKLTVGDNGAGGSLNSARAGIGRVDCRVVPQ